MCGDFRDGAERGGMERIGSAARRDGERDETTLDDDDDECKYVRRRM